MDSIVWILKGAAVKRYLRYGSIRLDEKICTLSLESALTRKKRFDIQSREFSCKFGIRQITLWIFYHWKIMFFMSVFTEIHKLGKPCPNRIPTLRLVSMFYHVHLLMIKAESFKYNIYKDNIMRRVTFFLFFNSRHLQNILKKLQTFMSVSLSAL